MNLYCKIRHINFINDLIFSMRKALKHLLWEILSSGKWNNLTHFTKI